MKTYKEISAEIKRVEKLESSAKTDATKAKHVATLLTLRAQLKEAAPVETAAPVGDKTEKQKITEARIERTANKETLKNARRELFYALNADRSDNLEDKALLKGINPAYISDEMTAAVSDSDDFHKLCESVCIGRLVIKDGKVSAKYDLFHVAPRVHAFLNIAPIDQKQHVLNLWSGAAAKINASIAILDASISDLKTKFNLQYRAAVVVTTERSEKDIENMDFCEVTAEFEDLKTRAESGSADYYIQASKVYNAAADLQALIEKKEDARTSAKLKVDYLKARGVFMADRY